MFISRALVSYKKIDLQDLHRKNILFVLEISSSFVPHKETPVFDLELKDLIICRPISLGVLQRNLPHKPNKT